MSPIVTAALIIIGNEILTGRTRDANLPYLAKRLDGIGVRLREVRVVPDDEAAIAAAVNELRAAHDYVFTTGGVGPTHDDITAASLAKAFGVPVERNAGAVALLEAYYAGSDLDLNEARLTMADMPAGAELIDNPVSGAPGFRIENVFVMAGVPEIMQAMFEALRPLLKGGAPVHSRTVTVDLPEGAIAATLEDVQSRNAGVEIGSYPFYRSRAFGVKLVLRAVDEARLAAATAELIDALAGLGGAPVEDDETG
ncbi:MAG: competence/damage-inducible protein A [Proteobacteria bacterium]|nr:competence/damage-inducible protein A [Pseudomonadota bacterium]